MNRLLIIGSNGFIGKIFCQNFINNNLKKWKITEITLISNKFDKLSKFKKHKHIKFVRSNFKDITILENYSNVIYAIKSKSYNDDKVVFSNFCKLAKKYLKNSKITYLSSGSVYGLNFNKHKMKETKMINPKNYINYRNYKNIYSKIKISNEKKIFTLSKSVKKISILRCFSFIGKNLLDDDYLLSCLFNYKNKKKLTLNQNAFRSFMNEKDLVNWILTINFFNKNFNIFNVGSDRVYSLKRIIKIFSSIKKINCSIKFIKDKVDFYIPDISKSKLFFNLKHNGNLKDNLLRIKN